MEIKIVNISNKSKLLISFLPSISHQMQTYLNIIQMQKIIILWGYHMSSSNMYQKNMYHHVSYGNLLRTLFFYSNLNRVQLHYTLPFLLFWTQWWNFLLQRRKSDIHTMFLICENFRRRWRKIFTFSIYGKPTFQNHVQYFS